MATLRRSPLHAYAFILSFGLLSSTALAQPASPPARPPSSQGAGPAGLDQLDYRYLRERREILQQEIPRAERSLDDMQSRLRGFERLDDDLQSAQAILLVAKADPKSTAENRQRLQDRVTYIEQDIKRRDRDLPQLKKSADDKQVELAGMRKELDGVEREINSRIDLETPRQTFKTYMSIVFAGLVGVVISGFFLIAWGDDTVRRDVFSGQAGLQFITLFALIIAIILFGIVGILEGKELAALLGGLSGYILGRSSGNEAEKLQKAVGAVAPAVRHGATT